MERRAGALRQAIRKHGGAKGAELPVALVENSSRAPTNDAGEKLLGNKRAWLPDLMTRVSHHLSHRPNAVTQCYQLISGSSQSPTYPFCACYLPPLKLRNFAAGACQPPLLGMRQMAI